MTTTDLTAPADPEAAAFFADARAALTTPTPKPAAPTQFELPPGWPITRQHQGPAITVAELHDMRGHATRVSFERKEARVAMWVGKEFGSWSIVQGQVGGPASLLNSSYDWAEAVRSLNEYIAPDRAFGGPDMTVDEWLPEFTLVCLAHGGDCADDGHNFVQRRTLPLYPVGTYRPCGGCHRDGTYRYRFQVDGRWRARHGCRSHHEALLPQYLAEADGTVTVRHLDNHLAGPAIAEGAA